MAKRKTRTIEEARLAFSRLDPKERGEAIARGKTMARLVLAETLKERLLKDGDPADDVEANVNADTAEEILSCLVKGDVVLDDPEVQGFFRRLLDDHREKIARILALGADRLRD